MPSLEERIKVLKQLFARWDALAPQIEDDDPEVSDEWLDILDTYQDHLILVTNVRDREPQFRDYDTGKVFAPQDFRRQVDEVQLKDEAEFYFIEEYDDIGAYQTPVTVPAHYEIRLADESVEDLFCGTPVRMVQKMIEKKVIAFVGLQHKNEINEMSEEPMNILYGGTPVELRE